MFCPVSDKHSASSGLRMLDGITPVFGHGTVRRHAVKSEEKSVLQRWGLLSTLWDPQVSRPRKGMLLMVYIECERRATLVSSECIVILRVGF